MNPANSLLSDEEEAQLRALGSDLESALQSPWEPRCIARAFATPRPNTIALTMQHWIDLDAIRSPLLLGELPERAADLALAADVFGLDMNTLEPEEAVDLARAFLRACNAAFAAALPMRMPGEGQETSGPDGFGTFAPLWAFLVAQCKVPPSEARAMRVDEAYILMATHRRNQGWAVAGTAYALRDLEEQHQPPGD